MNMKKIFDRTGMSTAEMLIALVLTVVVIAGVFMLSEFSQTIWKGERVKSNLINKLEFAMERIQKEMRLTDGHRVFYYPQSASSYSAVSFPLAADTDGDGFVEITDDDPPKIEWDQTVIYHTYANPNTGKIELRRTVFTPREDMTDSQRQAQLDDVAQNGYPTDTNNPEYSSWNQATGTRTLCDSDNIVMTITPTVREFDGYSSSTARSENVAFGSVPMDSGDHYITFTVIGKNSLSTGYRVGIDSFSITPSGCSIEAEEEAISDDGGGSKVNEDMSGYGSWNGNRQLEYQAADVTDYISFSFYYDKWIETNFATASPSNTFIEYGARTGDGGESSGASDYVARLDGCGDSWSSQTQTGASAKSAQSFDTGSNGVNFRNVIMSKNIDIEGRAIKATFDNTQDPGDMTIDYACLMERQGGPDGIAGTLKQITFDGGAAQTTIGAWQSKDSDWIDVSNFDRSADYLLTFHIPSSGTHNISSWVTPSADTQDDHSYYLAGGESTAGEITWSDKGAAAQDTVYCVDSIDVSYFSNGTLTSQIYDTGVDDPSYSTLSWGIAKNNYGDYETSGLGANLIIRVRASDDEDLLKAATDWSGELAINTKSIVAGSANINSIGSGRYAQFQAEFISQPTSGRNDYLKSCVLKNLSIKWPGQKRITEIGGYFTRRPDYGIFSVRIDGRDLIKALEVNLSMTETAPSGAGVTKYLTVEAQPRNTGK
jgi:hypothetical protein